MEELLFEGNDVLLQHKDSKNRKTSWEIIAAKRDDFWILTNSIYHNRIGLNIIKEKNISPFSNVSQIKTERTHGKSRFDFLVTHNDGSQTWVELKGCSLAVDGTALFPDAPTTRGQRHVKELRGIVEGGGRAAIVFLIFSPDAKIFSPKKDTDPKFTTELKLAHKAGVKIFPVKVEYLNKEIIYRGKIPLAF